MHLTRRGVLAGLLSCLLVVGQVQAAISFVAGSSAETGVSTSLTITKPSGTADGDVVIIVFNNGQDDGTTPTCTGFTNIGFVESAVTADNMTSIFYRVSSSDGASYSCDYPSSTSNQTSGIAGTFRGVDNTTPIDVTYVQANHYLKVQNTLSPTPQPITTVTNGAFVIVTNHHKGTVTTGITQPTSYTEVAEVIANNRYAEMAYREIVTAGTETPGSFTIAESVSDGTQDSAMFTIALRPASSGALLRLRQEGVGP